MFPSPWLLIDLWYWKSWQHSDLKQHLFNLMCWKIIFPGNQFWLILILFKKKKKKCCVRLENLWGQLFCVFGVCCDFFFLGFEKIQGLCISTHLPEKNNFTICDKNPELHLTLWSLFHGQKCTGLTAIMSAGPP